MAPRRKKERAAEEKASRMPEGFVPVTAERGEQCYIRPAEGLIVRGDLLGRFKRRGQRDDDPKFFYQVKIDAAIPGIRYVDGEASEETLESGTVVNVDEKTALEVLRDYAESGKLVKVWIEYESKVNLKSDPTHTFWQINVGVRPIKSTPPPEDKENIPF